VPEDGIAAIEAATARINWPGGSIVSGALTPFFNDRPEGG
jgi:hypothetical protein